MLRLLDVIHIYQFTDYLGWLPLLKLAQCSQHASQLLCFYNRGLLLWELQRCAMHLPANTELSLGLLVRLLHTLTVSNLLRWDCACWRGGWWSGSVAPIVELRAAVRYQRQDPPRQWQIVRGQSVRRDRLANVFPGNAFAGALETLAVQGNHFRFHRAVHRMANDAESHRVEVLTLYCTVRGFEIYLRWTQARKMDPADGSSSET